MTTSLEFKLPFVEDLLLLPLLEGAATSMQPFSVSKGLRGGGKLMEAGAFNSPKGLNFTTSLAETSEFAVDACGGTPETNW